MKNHIKITNHILTKATGLLLLAASFSLQGQAMACPEGKSDSKTTQGDNSVDSTAYYQSSDNPYRAD